jgi:HEAT repeat protein
MGLKIIKVGVILIMISLASFSLFAKEIGLTNAEEQKLREIQNITKGEELINIAKDKSQKWQFRESAIKRLGELGYKEAIPYLNQFVKEYNEYFIRTTKGEIPLEVHEKRRLIALSIAASIAIVKIEINNLPFEEQLKILKNKVKGNVDERTGALHVLREFGTATTHFMLKWLKDKDVWVRRAAVYTLEDNPDKIAIESLINALNDEDEYIQHAAIRALGKIEDERVIKPLIEKLKDKNKHIRQTTIKILKELGVEIKDKE